MNQVVTFWVNQFGLFRVLGMNPLTNSRPALTRDNEKTGSGLNLNVKQLMCK